MSISIKFKGICTHLIASGRTNGFHRVVLVRADKGAHIKDAWIPPHQAVLRITPDQIERMPAEIDGLQRIDEQSWRMRGVRFELNESDADFLRDLDLPPLTTEDGEEMMLAEDVAFNGSANCYFDLKGGRLGADTTPYGAIYAIVTAETAGNPVLKVTGIGSGKTSSIQLKAGAIIEIEHMGTAREGDSDRDYLLHYLVFERIPDKPFEPKVNKKKAWKNLPPGNVSVACSNSQYP